MPVEKLNRKPAKDEVRGPDATTSAASALQLRGKPLADQQAALAPGDSYADQQAALAPVQARGPVRSGGDVQQLAARGVSGGGGSMPHAAAIQHSFGAHDISGVAAHTSVQAKEAAGSIGARAYAMGNDIAFAETPSLHTAAHEAAHVVQQRAGVSLSGGVGTAGDQYEQHADQVADLVVQGKSSEGLLNQMTRGGDGSGVQMMAVQMEQDPEEREKAQQIGQVGSRMPLAIDMQANLITDGELIPPLSVQRDPDMYFWLYAGRNGVESASNDWLMNYNASLGPYNGYLMGLARIQAVAAIGVDWRDPDALRAEFQDFGATASSDKDLLDLKGQAVETSSTTAQLAGLDIAQTELRAAVSDLTVAKLALERAAVEAEKTQATAELGAIRAKIKQVVDTIAAIETFAAKAAMAYATGGTSLTIAAAGGAETFDMANTSQKSLQKANSIYGSATGAGIPIPTPSAVVGWLMEASYATEISDLNAKIAGCDSKLADINQSTLTEQFKSAATKVRAASAGIGKSKAELEQAVNNRREKIHNLAVGIDLERAQNSEAPPTDMQTGDAVADEMTNADGQFRAMTLLNIATSVLEADDFMQEYSKRAGAMDPGWKMYGNAEANAIYMPTVKRDGSHVHEIDSGSFAIYSATQQHDKNVKKVETDKATFAAIAAGWKRNMSFLGRFS